MKRIAVVVEENTLKKRSQSRLLVSESVEKYTAPILPSPLAGEGQGEGEGCWKDQSQGETMSNPTTKARHLRHQATDAEKKLWGLLRSRQLAKCKFRRQVSVGRET